MSTQSQSSFDFLLGTADSKQSLQSKDSKSATYEWSFFDTADILAPHPDAFESELDSLAAFGALDQELAALQAITTTLDHNTFNPSDLNLYTQYRGNGGHAYSAYSGYGPSTITSSESLSAYGSTYEPYEKHKLQLKESTAVSSGPQHTLIQQSFQSNSSSTATASLSSLFPDIDLDFAGFNLTAVTATQATKDLSSSMLPRLTLDTDTKPKPSGDNARTRSNGNSSAYDSASPPFDLSSAQDSAAGTYLSSTNVTAAPSYLGTGPSHPSLAGGLGQPGTMPPAASQVERNGTTDVDPRKKYQCPNCPRAFARAFNLKTHMATHDPNRVKAFVCRHSGCGRSFSRKHDLGRHLVSIHQDASGVGPSPTSPSGPEGGSSSVSRTRVSPTGSIGIGGDKQRVWCDSCGRGWLAGSRDTCDCVKTE